MMTEPTQQEWTARYGSALMNTFGPPKLVLARGEGCYLWDEEGNRYLDLLGGIAVNALGHAHPAVVNAVSTQLQTLGHISNFFASEPQIKLAERLVTMVGDPAARVFFTNSGTEANEAAFKLSRRTGRTHLVATERAFHGRTMGALALTSKAAYREPFEPLPGEVTFVPYGDAEALAAAVTERTAAIVLEPILGEAGAVTPPAGYLAAARQIATATGALLWLDEIQTGIGRTGQWLAHHGEGITPDVVTLAKGLGGGVPIGACIALGEAATLLQPGNHGTTFGGNPMACAAALAVLDTIEADALMDNVRSRSEQIVEGLGEQVDGRGLLLGIVLDGEYAASVVTAAQERGFIINAAAPDRIRLAPPLVLTAEQAQSFIDAWPEIKAAGRELDDAAQVSTP